MAEPHKLLAIAARIGVADTHRFLSKNVRFVARLLRSGGFYKPDGLLDGLAPTVADAAADVVDLHLYTFNAVDATERWRKEYLARLPGPGTALAQLRRRARLSPPHREPRDVDGSAPRQVRALDEPAEFGRSHYPPIADYAYVSDCESNGLIAPSGNVEWLCIPRPDSPSVFGAILDRSAGGFRFGPADVLVPAARRYIPGTMVVETSWNTRHRLGDRAGHAAHGPVASRRHPRLDPQARPDRLRRRAHPPAHRSLRERRGADDHRLRAGLRLRAAPRPVGVHRDGYRQGVCRTEGTDVTLTLTSDINLGFEGPRALARTLVKEGETRFVALSWGPVAAPTTFEEAYRRQVWTAHHWQHWLARGHFPDHPWRAYLERSALTLKGLTYAPSGAIIAAATTSLPETPHGERNWDYRYSWIRDSTFALWGLYTLGFDWEANDFMDFVADAAEGPGELQVMYGVGGERELEKSVNPSAR